MFHHHRHHWPNIITAAVVTGAGLLLFKYLPMSLFGRDILFDASAHIAWAVFVLYVLWFFVDQEKRLHTPFLIVSAMVLMVIAFQRLLDNAHNDIGLLGGFVLGLAAIGAAEWATVKKRLNF